MSLLETLSSLRNQLCSDCHPAFLRLCAPAADSLGSLCIIVPPRAPLPSAFHVSHQGLETLPRALLTTRNCACDNYTVLECPLPENNAWAGLPDPWKASPYWSSPSFLWDTAVAPSTWGCMCSVMADSLWPHGRQPTGLLCPWNSPGKNTGTDCHFLLQGIFLTQGLNPGLADSLPLHHLERPPGTWGKGVKGILCFPPSFHTLSYTLK